MHILGYLFTLANIQNFQNSETPLKDLKIKFGKVFTLYSELQATPGLELDRFRETGYYRYKNVGKYLSGNLRNFMFHGLGNPEDEGVVLTLFFAEKGDRVSVNYEDFSVFLHKGHVKNDEKTQVQDYLNSRFAPRMQALFSKSAT